MTEVDYLHECSRAELLGLPKPSRDEFFAKHNKTTAEEYPEEIEVSTEQIEDAGVRQEGFRRIGGGLDELNSILSSTQKKLNRFKVVCGSFGNLLKLQIGTKKEDSEKPDDVNTNSAKDNQESAEDNKEPGLESCQMHINKKGDSQLEKLDSLISKAERAELSLSSQNKQMRKFIN